MSCLTKKSFSPSLQAPTRPSCRKPGQISCVWHHLKRKERKTEALWIFEIGSCPRTGRRLLAQACFVFRDLSVLGARGQKRSTRGFEKPPTQTQTSQLFVASCVPETFYSSRMLMTRGALNSEPVLAGWVSDHWEFCILVVSKHLLLSFQIGITLNEWDVTGLLSTHWYAVLHRKLTGMPKLPRGAVAALCLGQQTPQHRQWRSLLPSRGIQQHPLELKKGGLTPKCAAEDWCH